MADFYTQLKKELNASNLSVEKLNEALKEILVATNKAAIRHTPIDTGLAANNWVVSEGNPSPQKIDESITKDYSERGSVNPNNIESIRNKVDVRAYNFPIDARTDEEYYVSNNTDYIEYLEDGISRQSPTGIVNPALADSQRRIEDILRKYFGI